MTPSGAAESDAHPGGREPGSPAVAPARPWLGAYPEGVPAEIGAEADGTLLDLFHEAASRYPERPALESFGVTLTYGAFAREAGAVAAWLQAEGLGPGDRVAIMAPNVVAYPVVLFGALLAGATIVGVNPLYTPRELAFQLADSGASILFVLENFAHVAERASATTPLRHVVVMRPGDLLGLKGRLINLVSRHVKRAAPSYRLPGSVLLSAVLAKGRTGRHRDAGTRPDDIAFLQYTGGTTGTPKGATLTHRNLRANIAQIDAWLAPHLGREPILMVTALPLYHIFALTGCLLLMVRLGGSQILIANPRDIPGLVKALKGRRFTAFNGVNTLFAALLREPSFPGLDFSGLTFCIAGGMAAQASVAAAWRAVTGRPIVEGYGLSETSPVVSVNRIDIDGFTGTIGYPLPSTEVVIRDERGGERPEGEPGEVCVRGPQVTGGYWNSPGETAGAFWPDGFFRTGDVGVLRPDGAIKLVDRIKDVVLVSGFNVYPNEVEDVLAGHPGIAEVAVTGAPDGEGGEVVCAYIVRSDPSLTEAAVKGFCRERLTPYKVPRLIHFRQSLPKTNVGKVLRRALRDDGPARDA